MAQNESAMAIIQASAFYDQHFGPHIYRQPDTSPAKNFTMSNSSSVSSPSSTNSNGLAGYQPGPPEEGHSVITFKPEFGDFNVHVNAGSSLLSFDQTKRAVLRNLNPKMIGEEEDHDQFPMWEAAADDQHLHYQSQMNPETSAAAEPWAWLNDQDPSGVTHDGVTVEENIGGEEAANNIHKRSSSGENLHAMKKQCVNVVGSSNASKKPKQKSVAQSKDPQSVAAKNRRERISERLKTLQELVPNGSKVDLVTMLEKAISYVKFLQLQVKVLAADEFWPAQGGKAPDLSQVREAIDAILASQRDRSSSSK